MGWLLNERVVFGLPGLYGQSSYDEQTNVWSLLALELTESRATMIEHLAPFRAAAAFSECHGEDYAAFTGYFYSCSADYLPAVVTFADGGSAMCLDHTNLAHVRKNIESQFAQAERDKIMFPYLYDGTPPEGTPRVSDEQE
ncbi:MAG: hypothetical protein FWE61_03070 [Micrococcales bacterium]|nr:hypothetical protein [Micrococcales bacterium]